MSKQKKSMKCTEHGMCWVMASKVSDSGKGLRVQEALNFKSGKVVFVGITYHEKATDRGLLLNVCPWCGEKPGEIANKKRPDPGDQAR